MSAPSRATARATPGALGLAFGLNLALGATYFGTKRALEGLPELSVVALRTIVAAFVLVPLTGLGPLRTLFGGGRETWLPLLAMGIGGYALPLALGSYGVAWSSATNAALLIGVEPISVMILGALVLGERLAPLRSVAIGLGLVGATTIVANGIPFLGTRYAPHLLGDLVLVAHGAAWAIYTIAAKGLVGRHPSLVVTTAAIVVALPLLVALAALELPAIRLGPTLLPALAWAAALGLFASALGTLLWNRALEQMDASTLAGFVFLQPVAGVLLGTLVLGERTSPWALLGGALVFAGVYALVSAERRRG
jgi:drug/metabolite transporter (DMT)-like permease